LDGAGSLLEVTQSHIKLSNHAIFPQLGQQKQQQWTTLWLNLGDLSDKFFSNGNNSEVWLTSLSIMGSFKIRSISLVRAKFVSGEPGAHQIIFPETLLHHPLAAKGHQKSSPTILIDAKFIASL
jgi:hypothetical protein